jgi:NAD(P)-dependent dehydrogenase (short-subunit alcohol dehydrogenase family)
MNGGVGGGEKMKYAGDPGSIHLRLDGLTALVTGGGRGIGAAAACTLAKVGAHVVVMSRTTSDLEQVVKNIQVCGGQASALTCDVTDGRRVREMIAELSRLDILINNSGMNIPGPFIDVAEEHLDTVINLNMRANFLVAQAAVRKMLEAPNRLLHDQARGRRAYESNGGGTCARKHPRQLDRTHFPGDADDGSVLSRHKLQELGATTDSSFCFC